MDFVLMLLGVALAYTMYDRMNLDFGDDGI